MCPLMCCGHRSQETISALGASIVPDDASRFVACRMRQMPLMEFTSCSVAVRPLIGLNDGRDENSVARVCFAKTKTAERFSVGALPARASLLDTSVSCDLRAYKRKRRTTEYDECIPNARPQKETPSPCTCLISEFCVAVKQGTEKKQRSILKKMQKSFVLRLKRTLFSSLWWGMQTSTQALAGSCRAMDRGVGRKH